MTTTLQGRNIQTLTNALDKVKQLRGVSYDWIDGDGPTRIGFIAQDIMKVEEDLGLPFSYVINKDNPDRLSLTFNNFVPILTNAIQELSAEIDNIKSILTTNGYSNP